MKIEYWVCLLFAVLLLMIAHPLNAFAENPGMTDSGIVQAKSFSCRRGPDVRSLWTEILPNRGCKLWYSHHDEPGAAASSLQGVDHCFAVADNILSNLSHAGFDCRLE